MNIADVVSFLDSVAPVAYQETYDNSGLLTGDMDAPVSGILVTMDVNMQVLEEAVAKNCNLVITHHPFIFRPLKKLTGEDLSQQLAIYAVRNNIAVYAMHTCLDNMLDGFNASFAGMLGLNNCRVLQPAGDRLSKLVTFCPEDHAEKVRNALFSAGGGYIGNYDCCSYNVSGQGTFRASDRANPFVGEKNVIHFEKETRIEVIYPRHIEKRLLAALRANHPYEEVAYDIYPLGNMHPSVGSGIIGDLVTEADEEAFLKKIMDITGIPVIRHSSFLGKPLKRVALCGGAGAFLVAAAIRSGAGAFLTSDLKYHDFFDVNGALLLADIGHYESEQWMKGWLHGILIEKFPNFATFISEINTNPVKYL